MLPLPSYESLVDELRKLRRRGLPGLRHSSRDSLRMAAVAAGLCTGEQDEQTGIEALLGAAVRRLNGGHPVRDDDSCDPLARAAAHTFGLFPARRGVPGTDRRKAAAGVYGVTTERFRKSQEVDVVAELAAAVLAVAQEGRAGAAAGPRPGGPQDLVTLAPTTPPVHVPPVAAGFPPRRRPQPGTAAPVAPAGRITVRVCPIELVRDVDILVSSENTYLEMSKTFRSTVSGALRRAAALRDASGEIVDDVLAHELGVWLRTHGRAGVPVRPGTVVATSSGALAAQGVRRIHHAAIAAPVGDGDRYHVTPAVLAEAVRTSFELARRESEFLSLPMSSICFPLMGTGRGGLSVETAARALLGAIRAELRQDPSWSVLVVTPEESHARTLMAASSAR
ncbi:macro domain-containing protein [Streptomyces sp. Ag109_G2-15]|uniref:macro domain-containing protein n=1 Tax=Streptomyces sp. Ag109_G2-15 TaxID=1938850 RepID=UPI000BCFEF66|nr:macro domain-containing protein [Streptomyces sp. Ag109_G2-15]SOE08133.1 O-acetyl-ADP-ribose deacetylase (regulator of RNase III), contains Macro domain [Streptomyces sp. Ag109_G2-15]